MTGATERIASFIRTSALEHAPPEAIPKAKKAIADTFAAILAGAGSEVAPPLMAYVENMRAAGNTPIFGTGRSAAPETGGARERHLRTRARLR